VIGIHHGMDEATYHADPCPEPSLSSGIIRALLRSPMHAHHIHPRLGGAASDDTQPRDDGTVLHSLILGSDSRVAVIEAPDYRKKEAQEQRDAARAAGLTPILRHRYDELLQAADGIDTHMPRLPPGHPEASLIWREGPTWCRARVDWLPNDKRAPLYDLKTTGLTANPAAWQRKLVSDYCIQAAWYLRGARALGLRPSDFVFIVAETEPPHGVATLACAPSLLAYAEREIDRAMAIWRRCLATNQWPGYPTATAYVEAPSWLLEQQEERALNDEILEEMT
jgi:hypothetical protein